MRKNIELNADGYAKKHRQKRIWYRIMSVLACAVVFCTTYALILPAITMDTSYDTYCGIEQHTHTDACYEVAGVPEHVEFACEAAKQTEKQVVHTHNTFCFDESGELICPLEEYNGEQHTHGADCYVNGILTCGIRETMVHDHCEACRITVGAVAPKNLLCTKQEHIHTADCFTEKVQLSATDAVKASELEAEDEGAEGVEMSKQIRVSESGYELKLDTFVTGTTVKTTTFSPADIVLVLDASRSMEDNVASTATYATAYTISTSGTYYIKSGTSYAQVYYCSGNRNGGSAHTAGWYTASHSTWNHNSGTRVEPKTSATDSNSNHVQFYTKATSGSISKKNALLNSVNSFLDSLENDSSGQTSAHSVTVISFTGSVNSYKDSTKVIQSRTEINESNKSTIKNTIKNGLTTVTCTPAESGLNYALNEINKTNNDRQKYVVMFTDGEPNHYMGFDSEIAVKAIQNAYKLKNNATEKNKAIIYAVGIFGNSVDSDVYPYMHLVSSNYNLTSTNATDAGFTALAENVESNTPSGYFLTADTSAELNAVFNSISSEISKASIELHEDTQLRDVITDSFKLDINADMGRGVQVFSSKCTSVTSDGKGGYTYTWQDDAKANWLTFYESGTQNLQIEGDKTIQLTLKATTGSDRDNDVWVSGFDFADNWVGLDGSGTVHGRKITMIIPLIQTDLGEGGEEFPETNGPESGVYDKDGKPIDKYQKPSVQVPVMMRFTLQTKNVSTTDYPAFYFTAGNGADTVVFDEDGWDQDDWTDKLTLSEETIKEELEFNLKNLGNDKTSDKSIYANRGDTVMLKSTAAIPKDCVVYINDKAITLNAENKVEYNVTSSVSGVTLKEVNIRIERNAGVTVKCEIYGDTDANKTFDYKVTVVDQDNKQTILNKTLKNGETWDLGSQPGNSTITVEELSPEGYTVLLRLNDETVTKSSKYTFTLSGNTDIVVQNYTGTAFPATGGSGTTLYIICGSALMLAAVVGGFVLTFQKRKKGIWG